mgnify:CR=1 FL=1
MVVRQLTFRQLTVLFMTRDRVMYLRNYLSQLQRATADGIPVKGYFLWSLMDNFEWARRLHESFWTSLRRLCDAEEDAEIECGVLQGSDRSQRSDLTGMIISCRSTPSGNEVSTDTR